MKVPESMNLNTWIALVGFGITLAGGYSTYTSFKSNTELWKQQVAAQVEELKAQRAEDVAYMRVRVEELSKDIQSLTVQDARQIEQISAMIVYLQRIERTLDALVKREVPTKGELQ